MPDARTLAYIVLWVTAIGQVTLLLLQVHALAKYKHWSFGILAFGSFLGFVTTTVTLLMALAPSTLLSATQSYAVAMICAAAQIPFAIIGVAWLFRSYGQLQQAAAME